FTSSKALAIELTISFKTVASQILTDEQKDQIREIVDERREERKALRDDKIAELRKEYNKEKAKEIAQRLGVGVESIENIESEDLTANEIKRRLINDFRKLDDSQKERLVTNLREENQKIRLEARQKEEELRSKYEERIRDLETKLREREKQSEIKIREDANT